MKKVLVHSCCAPCSTYSYSKLYADGYDVTGFFYNPNIQPQDEYNRRLNEYISYCAGSNIKNIADTSGAEGWLSAIKGLESEPERGLRCNVCFRYRLEKTAQTAVDMGFDTFATVLTISPHKDSKAIFEIGESIAKVYKLSFLMENFKKQNGFKKSLEMSVEHGLYRQNYCGCLFSKRT